MLTIERVNTKDTKELLEIYAPYVENTAVSFEYAVPSIEEFKGRIEQISSKFPYIKAVEDGKIVGYAYANSFKGRKAYDWSVETTIYVKPDCRQSGIGRKLYEQLERSLKGMGILNMNACIACPAKESFHLNDDSIRFHTAMGFLEVGKFHDSGYKFNEWFDMIWMEKIIGEHDVKQPDVKFGDWILM